MLDAGKRFWHNTGMDSKEQQMVTVKVEYPGKDHYFTCDRVAAEFLIAQFERNEWIVCTIMEQGESV
jgi:hypothetical protein